MTFILVFLILTIPFISWSAFKQTKLRGFKRFALYVVWSWISEILLFTLLIQHLV